MLVDAIRWAVLVCCVGGVLGAAWRVAVASGRWFAVSRAARADRGRRGFWRVELDAAELDTFAAIGRLLVWGVLAGAALAITWVITQAA